MLFRSVQTGCCVIYDAMYNIEMSAFSKKREHQAMDGAYQLIESTGLYKAHFKAEKSDIDHENTYFWDLRIE